MVKISAEQFGGFINQEGVLGHVVGPNVSWNPQCHLDNINQMNACRELSIMWVRSEEDMMNLLVNGLNAANPLREPFDRKLLICQDCMSNQLIVLGVIINDSTMKIITRKNHHEFGGALNQDIKIYDYSEMWKNYLAKLLGSDEVVSNSQYVVQPFLTTCHFQ